MTVQLFRKKGEITVFLALILSVTLGFICIVFESARSQSIKFQKEVAMDGALRSCFGEYHRELFEKYHLLYIDSSYRVNAAGMENVTDHMASYMQENLDFEKEAGTDYFSIEVTDTIPEEYLIASDMDGLPVYKQANNYLKTYGDISHSGQIAAIRNEICRMDSDGIFGEWDSSLLRVNSFGVSFINPSEVVRGMASDAANQLIGTLRGKLSGMPYGDIPSKRSLNKGNYSKVSKNEEELIFSEYLYQNCGSFVNPKPDSVLSCEQEYLIYGYTSDEKNLKAVIERLLRIFSKSCLEYTEAHEEECREYAEMVVPPPPDPEDAIKWFDREALVDAVSDSLKYAWAEAEAILKVNRLLGGGWVSASNPSDDWIIPLYDITFYASRFGGSGGSGYCYEEFLSAFLKNMSRKTICMRFLDLVEVNMRNMGSPGFMADGCIEYMKIKIETTSAFGYEYSITRDYAYEDEYRNESNA